MDSEIDRHIYFILLLLLLLLLLLTADKCDNLDKVHDCFVTLADV